MNYTKLAIIGTAGRKEDQAMLTAAHYTRMVDAVVKFMGHVNIDPQMLHLYSGGAAWADHLAVTLTLMGVVPYSNLTIFLPAILEADGFVGANEYLEKVAGTANYYHRLFFQKTGHNGIQDLLTVREKGAVMDPGKSGFKTRNTQVARALDDDGTLLAFTFGSPESTQPVWTIRSFPMDTKADIAGLKDGGTADTFNKAKCPKHHARLGPMDHDYLSI